MKYITSAMICQFIFLWLIVKQCRQGKVFIKRKEEFNMAEQLRQLQSLAIAL